MDSGTFRFGTAKIVCRDGKWYFRFLLRFLTAVHLGPLILSAWTEADNAGKTTFVSGRALKNTRTKYKILRRNLQRRQTPSARRRLKKIGQRENRWMQHVNHCIARTLVNSYPSGTLFVPEDLTGIRCGTEKVRRKDRYAMVLRNFCDRLQKFEYKARMNGSAALLVDPAYAGWRCHECGQPNVQTGTERIIRSPAGNAVADRSILSVGGACQPLAMRRHAAKCR